MPRPSKYDFSGWVTRNDILCSDGRTIKRDAFKDQDGQTVPLVWQHMHDNPENVLGHIYLENRPEGVYGYGSFNESKRGIVAKEGVKNGDIDSLSIFAHRLQQDSKRNVMHGKIVEVSLVMAGANLGAKIDHVLAHSDEDADDVSAIITNPMEDLELYHADGKDENMAEENKAPETEEGGEGKTLQDVFDTLNEEQKQLLYVMVATAKEEGIQEAKEAMAHSEEDDKDNDSGETDDQTIQHNESNKEDDEMSKQNAFDANGVDNTGKDVLTHSMLNDLLASAKANHRSLKETIKEAGYTGEDIAALESETLAHSVTTIGNFFPENKLIPGQPALVARSQEWVGKLLGAVKRSPFSRIRSMYADITADNARAKGYATGEQKVEEVIVALKRTTDPYTVYKLQKLNRDDVLDITEFNVIEFIKSEMRTMLNEEVARAILVGDGRANDSPDKIDETKIRPIWTDTDVYTIKAPVVYDVSDTDTSKLKKFIKACHKARKNYRGSGEPDLYTTEDMITDLLLMEDNNGRVIYDTVDRLARALRVRSVIGVPVMEGLSRTVVIASGEDAGTYTHNLLGIIVNANDYICGADRGGNVTMFDDFDLDFNKLEYLIETRLSGALTIPYSAIAVENVVKES